MLHHAIDPKRCLLEIYRIIKKNSSVFLYLYENHSENSLKYIAVKIIAKIRNITVKINSHILYFFCFLSSPFVFIIFSFPASILKRFKATQRFFIGIPFNFGDSFFSLTADLYDRFSAPIEHRFSRDEIYCLFVECGFQDINITRLKESAGWVIWGHKNRC